MYDFFDLLEKYELLQIHHSDDDQISATQKTKFKVVKMHPKMLECERYEISYIEVIEENKGKNEFIFFSTHKWLKDPKEFLDKLDLIIDPPFFLDKDRLLVSIITESKKIDVVFNSLHFFYNGDLEILSISNIYPNYEIYF